MPSTYNRILPPRRCSDRRVRSKAFKSVFKYAPVEPPFRYWLTSEETRAALGIDRDTQLQWVRSWKSTGFTSGTGPRPILMDDNTYRYEWNELTNAQPGEEWLDIFRRNRAEWIEADKLKSRTLTATA